MIHLDEYRNRTVKEILDQTGLENPYSDQSKYSLARQKELLLKDAKKMGVIDKVVKTHPREYRTTTVLNDNGMSILYSERVDEPKPFTHILDLNSITHKVIRENKKVIIEVKKQDIPNHVLPNPKPGYVYDVIGIFTQEKCYANGPIDPRMNSSFQYTKLGTKYRFGFHSNVSLHILD